MHASSYRTITIGVDPGVEGLGLAFINEDLKLLHFASISPGKGDWGYRMEQVLEKLVQELLKVIGSQAFEKVTYEMCIEFPEYFESGGQVAVSSGSLVKLAYIAGAIEGTIRGTLGDKLTRTERIKPRTWKGQLSKAITQARLKRRGYDLKSSSHAWDALGIALYANGVSMEGSR